MDLKYSQQKHAGFTLTELMIVIAIMGILMAIGAPSYFAWRPNHRLKSAVRDLQGNFQLAKLEAVKRGTNVAIEFTTAAYAALLPSGYVVFVDTDNDRHFDNPGETMISQAVMPADIWLVDAPNHPTNFNINGSGNPALSFGARGLPNQGGTVTIRNNQNISGHIIMNLTGRVSIRRSTSTDGGVTWAPPAPDYEQWD